MNGVDISMVSSLMDCINWMPAQLPPKSYSSDRSLRVARWQYRAPGELAIFATCVCTHEQPEHASQNGDEEQCSESHFAPHGGIAQTRASWGSVDSWGILAFSLDLCHETPTQASL
jgi:hypothetical protein